MSAIAGVIDFAHEVAEGSSVRRMLAAMSHRGDDGVTIIDCGRGALGHRARRTRSSAQFQVCELPAQRLAVVLDGHLHNLGELNEQLALHGHEPAEDEARAIALAYLTWGEDCADRLVGQFALALWDETRSQLYAACDNAGTRQLVYQSDGMRFLFASECAAVAICARSAPRINEWKLLQGLAEGHNARDAEQTIYAGIHRLPAGHALVASAAGVRCWRYWRPELLAPLTGLSRAECAQGLRAVLTEAVRCRIDGASSPGAMLSGGLDSSAIVAVASTLAGGGLETFTLADATDPQHCAEVLAVQAMAQPLRLRARFVELGAADSVFHRYLESGDQFEDPFEWFYFLPLASVIETAAHHGRRVLLEGGDGDLLFYSADASLQAIARRRMYARLPSLVRAYRNHGLPPRWKHWAWRLTAESTPESLRALYRRMKPSRFALHDEMFATHLSRLRPHVRNRYLEYARARRPQRLWSSTVTDAHAHTDKLLCGVVQWGHQCEAQMAERIGIEQRSPFADRRVMEFAVRMPVEAKLFSEWYKHVLRLAIEDIAPAQVVWRRDIGYNPGRSHLTRLVGRWEPSNRSHSLVMGCLERWLCPDRMQALWSRLREAPTYELKYAWFQLDRVAHWLDTHRL